MIRLAAVVFTGLFLVGVVACQSGESISGGGYQQVVESSEVQVSVTGCQWNYAWDGYLVQVSYSNPSAETQHVRIGFQDSSGTTSDPNIEQLLPGERRTKEHYGKFPPNAPGLKLLIIDGDRVQGTIPLSNCAINERPRDATISASREQQPVAYLSAAQLHAEIDSYIGQVVEFQGVVAPHWRPGGYLVLYISAGPGSNKDLECWPAAKGEQHKHSHEFDRLLSAGDTATVKGQVLGIDYYRRRAVVEYCQLVKSSGPQAAAQITQPDQSWSTAEGITVVAPNENLVLDESGSIRDIVVNGIRVGGVVVDGLRINEGNFNILEKGSDRLVLKRGPESTVQPGAPDISEVRFVFVPHPAVRTTMLSLGEVEAIFEGP